MMEKILILVLLINIYFSSNDNKKSEQEKENERLRTIIELKDKEINLRDREIALKEKELESLEKGGKNNEFEEKTLTQLYNNVKNSVFLILTLNNEGISQGSAFIISSNGLAVSNYHVFEKAAKVIAINNQERKFVITEIIEINKEHDYIIFKIGPLKEQIPYLSISENLPSIGEQCFTVGNPKGLVQTLSTGIISGYRDANKYIQTTTEITNGSSGGPLFNYEGEVIGITTAGYGEANLNFAININKLNIGKYLSEKNSFFQQLTQQQCEKIIHDYYQTLINEDLNSTYNMYSDFLNRYHTLYSISKLTAINDHQEFLKKYKIVNADIENGSIIFSKTDEEYVLQYRRNWDLIIKKNNRKLSYVLETVLIIDENGKIKSVFDNILSKSNKKY